ncbi:MAG: tetratricopeptide repeat protein [Verrucomicrobiota bacterium]
MRHVPRQADCLTRVALCTIMVMSVWTVSSAADAAEIDPKQFQLLQESSSAFTFRQYEKAEQGFQELLSQLKNVNLQFEDESISKIYYMLAMSQIFQKKYDAAIETINHVDFNRLTLPSIGEELYFWLGVAYLRAENGEKAVEAFSSFIFKYPRSERLDFVRLQLGLSLVQEQKYQEAADYFKKAHPLIKQQNIQDQAKVLELHSLSEIEFYDEALMLVQEFDDNPGIFQEITAFQLLVLDLGAVLFDLGNYEQALIALQRVWSKEEIVRYQNRIIGELKSQLERMENAPVVDEEKKLIFSERIKKLENALISLEEIPDYNAAVQTRIADSFYELERYEEANLVFQRMIKLLPDSDLAMQAHFKMIQGLTKLERWYKTIASCNAFLAAYPEEDYKPHVLYIKGECQMRLARYAAASETLFGIHSAFPDFQEAQRSLFLSAYSLLMDEQFTAAAERYVLFVEKYPDPQSELFEDAHYWHAMTYYYDQKYEKALELFQSLVELNPEGRNAEDAEYRIAHSIYCMKRFEEASVLLVAYLEKYPESINRDEACNLLGDCYFALGEIDEGILAYQKTSNQHARYYDYAYFRIGTAFKKLEQFDQMEQHFTEFLTLRPGSSRLPEALLELAWLHQVREQPEQAVALYWDSIKQYGNNPESYSIEGLFDSVHKLMRRNDQGDQFVARLQELERHAAETGQTSLQARSLWKQADIAARENPEQALELTKKILMVAKPIELSSQGLADTGERLRLAGEYEQAHECFRTILFWYPRSLLKERAYASLGLIAVSNGQLEEALDYFNKFKKHSVNESALTAEVLMASAEIHAGHANYEQAIHDLEQVLKIKAARGLPWVKALYAMGTYYMEMERHKKAIACFQRIYVMYGRWSEYVAKAYWQSGRAFEQINDREAARKTFQELVESEQLKEFPEHSEARKWLQQA